MRFNLKKEMFSDREFTLIENNGMKATAFKYSTGVEALKIENSRGYFIILPYQGQQIWRAHFLGKDLHMKTMMDEPQPSKVYLQTYGGFLLHCGIAAFGVPSKDDKHVQHGEIPNADYQSAYLECGEDYMAVGGKLDYDESFVRNYSFCPECRLYENDSVLKINIDLVNRRSNPMEYMYLCHINFRPFDGARIISTAKYDSENFTVYKSEGSKALTDYMDAVEKNPAIMDTVGGEGQCYDPEICFGLRYNTDEYNRAYSLQYREDGACYVSHPADALPYGIRWISRTENEDAIGIVLPATGEHLGYENAKAKGQIKLLGANETLNFYMEEGWLDKNDADKVKAKIEKING